MQEGNQWRAPLDHASFISPQFYSNSSPDAWVIWVFTRRRVDVFKLLTSVAEFLDKCANRILNNNNITFRSELSLSLMSRNIGADVLTFIIESNLKNFLK